MDTTGLVGLAVGLLLCYAGVRSVHLALLASGFAVGWLGTEPFNASFVVALVVGAATAAAAVWVPAHLVFRVAMFCSVASPARPSPRSARLPAPRS